MKKKTIIYTVIFTVIFIIAPCCTSKKGIKNQNNMKKVEVKKIDKIDDNKKYKKNDVNVFSSNTCFKKTYYINKNNVNVYDKNDNYSKVLFSLNKDDIVIAYKEKNGYLYCEEGSIGRKGWIKKNKDNIKGFSYKNTEYKIDVDLIDQMVNVYKNDKIIKKINCSTGLVGNQDTETPVGMFYIMDKGKYFYSNKYNQGGRYYIKFFANYLIHSIPLDKNGNIIEEEKDKLGFPASHGCIRVSIDDAKWLYNNVPKKSLIFIHY
ncbi:L,D-transpeptidase [Clostridium niameyense]|uniref:L,D-transpeptidase n=1 Tax=Clostridium niameyense TaxID=1622073 RepID=A0A6M0RCV8_9CLOT|nr:L,D-transpeptidase [Clostridium niameyense]NEZ48013.1 L,D-transpeptidase [Clostridium niameyense]